MTIQFETFDIPKSTCNQEISPKQREKIVNRLKKINTNLQKKMKRISRLEAEAWKKSRHRGKIKK